MEYVRLGRTGIEVSRLCLGTMSFGRKLAKRPWVLELDEARPLFRKAWESGINFFDTSNTYAEGSSEEVTGILTKELAPRHELILATKVCNRVRPGPNGAGLSRKAIMHEIDLSLKRLGTDYVDLYQIHRHDPHTPYEVTMEAMHDVVKAGKARYIGASSMYVWQFLKYQHAAELDGLTKFMTMQNQISLVYREEEREMLPLCRNDGIAVIPWGPLGAGKVTRPWGTKTDRSTSDALNKTMYEDTSANDPEVIAAVERVAVARGVPMAQVALAWVLQKSGVTAPIIGASRLSHLDDALSALRLELDASEIAALEAPYRPRSIHF
ncbi:alcohol dehydrogenase [Microvirga sp. KLBC 81]|uniref:aldo/keto reductase n=1 Tax=Microvirga sp. KLBC 81 TaxID=1862707 RepID=UPI000D506B6E|nr:aldo/keto reductase [Microvirga sp. KLBC 81]PVE21219.1 alcohol dehydrogenase [Microvirga sp. KLBC 81]